MLYRVLNYTVGTERAMGLDSWVERARIQLDAEATAQASEAREKVERPLPRALAVVGKRRLEERER